MKEKISKSKINLRILGVFRRLFYLFAGVLSIFCLVALTIPMGAFYVLSGKNYMNKLIKLSEDFVFNKF